MGRITESRVFKGNNVLIVSLICAVATIPLHNNLNSWALVFFCTMGFIYALREPVNLRLSPLVAVSSAFFIWLTLTVFWDRYGLDLKFIEGYAAFLFLPFILSIIPTLPERAVRQVCVVLALIATVIILVCLVKSGIEYRSTGDYRVFFYHYLSGQMELNAIFLSSYCMESIVWLLYFWFIHPNRPGRPGKWVIVIWCLFLFLSVFLLSSKLIISLTIICIAFLLLYIGYKRKHFIKSVLALLLVAGLAGFAVSRFHYVNWRFAVTEFRDYRGEIDNQNGLAIRLLMWQSAWELIKERPITGYGVKGADKELIQKFKEKNFALGVNAGYHAHNQYLQTALVAGFVGLALFAAFLVMIAIRAFRYKNILLCILLLHFMTLSIVESTLEVQQELVFYVFFLLLFYYHFKPSVKTSAS